MIDMTDIIGAALDTIEELNGQVYDNHPHKKAIFPCITFSETQNSEGAHADNEEIASDIEYLVEVWDYKKSTISGIADKVNAKMQGLGFVRTHAFWMRDDKLWRRGMRYRKLQQI